MDTPRQDARAWRAPSAGLQARRRSGSDWGDLGVQIAVQHRTRPFLWDEYAGIEWWRATLELSFDGRSLPAGTGSVAIATAWLVRVDTNLCRDLPGELDMIAQDLASIGTAIDDSLDKLGDWGIHSGMNSDIVLAQDVVVDKYWRGARLGPALTLVAASALRADALFLIPVALPTRVGHDGVCRARYDLPRGGPEADHKVTKAWRRAGLRSLRYGVLWSLMADTYVEDAHRRIRHVEDVLGLAPVRDWCRRRARYANRRRNI